MELVEYGLRIDWKNSATNKPSEAVDRCTLPAELTAGRPARKIDFPETYMFEDPSDASALLQTIKKWEGRIPMIRDGAHLHDRGDRIWWVATVTNLDPIIAFVPCEPPDPFDTPIIDDPNIDIGRE